MTATHRTDANRHEAPHASADDPRVTLDRDLGVFEPVPPYPPRTEREAEFYTLGDGEMFINMGPHHPSTHGVLRVVMKIDGEKVVDLDPVLGYLHRGVEKLCENADFHHTISYMDPLEYVSSLFCEWPAVMAYEKLLDVRVPRRAEYIRVLTGELNRISSHALAMGFQALDLGGLTPILYSFIERDEIVDMLASITGQRMLFNYFRIGGVNGDLNHDFMSRLGDWMGRATEQIEANTGLLNENEIFVRRNRGLGVIDSETALRMCWSGPNLRATGIPYDLRRAHPYSVYPELDFDIPTRSEGDALARYLLRIDEIRQSLRIIDQCLHQMPDGPVLAKLPRLLRPRPGRAWAAVEGPRGEYGIYAMSDGTDQPFRFRIHDPSFLHLQSFNILMPGRLIADWMAINASLDPIMGGVDK
jgi:NADH-quinone oxidoreductase subunit D